MQRHPVIGHEILKDSASKYVRMGALIALGHHEKFDGSGYPYGLVGDHIPLSARIVAVADVYDALTSRRPYKTAWLSDEAFKYLQAHRGAHFDPLLVDAFVGVREDALAIQEELKDAVQTGAASPEATRERSRSRACAAAARAPAERPDTEHEQAIVRLVVGAVFFFYLLPAALSDGPGAGIDGTSLLLPMFGFMVLAAAIFAEHRDLARRVAGAPRDRRRASTARPPLLHGADGRQRRCRCSSSTSGSSSATASATARRYLLITLVLSGIGFARRAVREPVLAAPTLASAWACCSRWWRSPCTC